MVEIVITIALLVAGYFTGSILEKNHFKQIEKDEEAYSHIILHSFEELSFESPVKSVYMVSHGTVISHDYFKRFVASLVNIFGGRVTVYESLLDRARREVQNELKKQASQLGASEVSNVRLETSSISKHNTQNQTGCIEVYAYGTAICYEKQV
ncbi:YbjQ family protein [bacterium]|nr:YbjQ family protein [bacterium]